MNLNLRTYLILSIFLSSISLITNDIFGQIALIFASLLILFFKNGNLKILKNKKIKMLFKVFLSLFIIQILFRQSGEIIFQLAFLKITFEGLKFAFSSISRLFVITLLGLSIISSNYEEFVSALNTWKIPNDISFMIYSTIYFIPFFHRKVVQNLEAMKIRGIFFKDLSITEKLWLLEEITFPIIAKSLTEIKMKAAILELRGFRYYQKKTCIYYFKLRFLELFIQITAFFGFLIFLLFHFS